MSSPSLRLQRERIQKAVRPYRTSVAVILQTKSATANESASFDILAGWSRCLTQKGMTFVCKSELPSPQLCLYVEHPDTDCTFFEAEIVNSQEVEYGVWEYEVVFRKLLWDIGQDA